MKDSMTEADVSRIWVRSCFRVDFCLESRRPALRRTARMRAAAAAEQTAKDALMMKRTRKADHDCSIINVNMGLRMSA